MSHELTDLNTISHVIGLLRANIEKIEEQAKKETTSTVRNLKYMQAASWRNASQGLMALGQYLREESFPRFHPLYSGPNLR